MKNKTHQGPKVLLLDIETAPLLVYCWSIWQQDIGLNQIEKDWHVLSWAAKWLHDSKMIYMDQRNVKNIEDDKNILAKLWELIDQADIIVTQNGKSFDMKKLNARFIIHGFQPPSTFKHIDTKIIAKKHFGFTSNKLEYMSKKLGLKFKKSNHAKFSGFQLWIEVMKGNVEAWKEMQKYNEYDVLSLEELYKKLSPWDNSINFSLYYDEPVAICKCGGENFKKNGYFYTNVGKYQRFKCKQCGAENRSRTNLFDKDKKTSIKVGTIR